MKYFVAPNKKSIAGILSCVAQEGLNKAGTRAEKLHVAYHRRHDIELAAERGRIAAFSAVFEPLPDVTIAGDYWRIKLNDKVADLPEQTIFGNFEKYWHPFLRTPVVQCEDSLRSLGRVAIPTASTTPTRTRRTNQGTMFQLGFDPRYTDPVGRALYLRASYIF